MEPVIDYLAEELKKQEAAKTRKAGKVERIKAMLRTAAAEQTRKAGEVERIEEMFRASAAQAKVERIETMVEAAAEADRLKYRVQLHAC